MGGWEDEEEEWGLIFFLRGGGVWGWRVIAPDAHTPTITNYHCVMANKEEVKTEAPSDPDDSVCPFLSTETRENNKEGGRRR